MCIHLLKKGLIFFNDFGKVKNTIQRKGASVGDLRSKLKNQILVERSSCAFFVGIEYEKLHLLSLARVLVTIQAVVTKECT